MFLTHFKIVSDFCLTHFCFNVKSNTFIKRAWLEMSNELNKIWLKRLNSRILKNERLNWSKVSKWTNSKINWELRTKNIFNLIKFLLWKFFSKFKILSTIIFLIYYINQIINFYKIYLQIYSLTLIKFVFKSVYSSLNLG